MFNERGCVGLLFFFLNVNDSELCVMAHNIKENPFTSPNVSRVITQVCTLCLLLVFLGLPWNVSTFVILYISFTAQAWECVLVRANMDIVEGGSIVWVFLLSMNLVWKVFFRIETKITTKSSKAVWRVNLTIIQLMLLMGIVSFLWQKNI